MVGILAVETSGNGLSLALGGPAWPVTEVRRDLQYGHAEHIAPMLLDFLKEHDVSFESLSGLAVCVGPGSYTGIRVGVSAVKALGYVLQKPVVGLTGFEIMQEKIGQTLENGLLVIDSRRSEPFVQEIKDGKTKEASYWSPQEIKAWAAKNDAQIWVNHPNLKTIISGAQLMTFSAADMIVLAEKSLVNWLERPVSPFYVREPDITMPKGNIL